MNQNKPIINDPASASFEDKIKEIKEIIKKFEDGSVPLEQSIKNFTRGQDLIKNCEEILNQVQNDFNNAKTN